MTVIMVGLSGLCAVGSLAMAKVRDCDKMLVFCGADFVLAIMHIVFAFYLQRRLVNGLSTAQPGQSGQVNAKELMNTAGHIIMYDVGFCLYMVGFVVSFGWNCVGLGWIGKCDDGTVPWIAAVLMLLYGFFATAFAVVWYFAMCCDDCCGGLFGMKSPVSTGGQPQQNKGITRIVMGKSAYSPSGQQQQAFTGTPVQGHVVQPPPTTVGQAAPPQQGMGAMAAGALGGGLQAVGKVLQGGGKK